MKGKVFIAVEHLFFCCFSRILSSLEWKWKERLVQSQYFLYIIQNDDDNSRESLISIFDSVSILSNESEMILNINQRTI
jgi:hypothetical protein